MMATNSTEFGSSSSRNRSFQVSITTTNMASIDTFPLFPKLPLELRRKIWDEACKIPRMVDVWGVPVWGKRCRDFTKECFHQMAFIYKTSRPSIPAILHTSQEARSIGLEHYKLSLATNMTGSIGDATVQLTSPGKVYFNPEYDLFLPMSILADVRGESHHQVFDPVLNKYFPWSLFHGAKEIVMLVVNINDAFQPSTRGRSSDPLPNHRYTCQNRPGIKEIVFFYDGNEALTRYFDSKATIDIEFILLDGDIGGKIADAGMEDVVRNRILTVKRVFEKSKSTHRRINSQNDGRISEGHWDPIISFMLVVERKT